MSSGFKENFERGESENLDYDDSAFYYFGLAILLISLIPATYYMILEPMLFGDIRVNYSNKNCKCDTCLDRINKRALLYRFTWLNTGFMIKFAILSVMWFMCYQCF